jgi:hypothetical protein
LMVISFNCLAKSRRDVHLARQAVVCSSINLGD